MSGMQQEQKQTALFPGEEKKPKNANSLLYEKDFEIWGKTWGKNLKLWISFTSQNIPGTEYSQWSVRSVSAFILIPLVFII